MDPNQTLGQYQSAMQNYMGMAPANQQQVMSGVMAKVNNLQPQYQEMNNAQTYANTMPAQTLGNMQNMYGNNNGPDQFTRLNLAIGNANNTQSTVGAYNNAIQGEQQKLNGLGSNILDSYNQARQMQGTNANNLMNLYNTQLSNQTSIRNAQIAAGAQEQVARQNSALGYAQLKNQSDYQQQLLNTQRGLNPDGSPKIVNPINNNYNQFANTNNLTSPSNPWTSFLGSIQPSQVNNPNAFSLNKLLGR